MQTTAQQANRWQIRDIHVRYLKSAQGEEVPYAEVFENGLALDHQWAVVTEDNVCVAQRSSGRMIGIRSMCLVQARRTPGGGYIFLSVPSQPEKGSIGFPEEGTIDGEDITVQMSKDQVQAVVQGPQAAEWITSVLAPERPGKYKIVRMSETYQRPSSRGGGWQRFHDGYPITIITTNTHDDIMNRIEDPSKRVSIDRWRATLVVEPLEPSTAPEPFAEDHFDLARSGPAVYRGQTLCYRCPMPAINQFTAVQEKEPIVTAATYRRGEHIGLTDKENAQRVFVSRNFTVERPGIVLMGMELEILQAS